jgi:hypothetical protein
MADLKWHAFSLQDTSFCPAACLCALLCNVSYCRLTVCTKVVRRCFRVCCILQREVGRVVSLRFFCQCQCLCVHRTRSIFPGDYFQLQLPHGELLRWVEAILYWRQGAEVYREGKCPGWYCNFQFIKMYRNLLCMQGTCPHHHCLAQLQSSLQRSMSGGQIPWLLLSIIWARLHDWDDTWERMAFHIAHGESHVVSAAHFCHMTGCPPTVFDPGLDRREDISGCHKGIGGSPQHP